MSALPIYLKQLKERKRLRRQYVLQNLRSYLREMSDEDLTAAIQRLTDINDLKLLWEAGLRAPLQRAVSVRIEELTRRRTR